MKVGYARTSTIDQKGSLESQKERLKSEAGCEKVFAEQISGAAEDRPQLNAALDYIRDGDELIVTKLDRAARSTGHLHRIIEYVHQKGATLRVLDMGLDTSTSHGRLVVGILGEIAQFERDLLRERQQEGIERTKREEPHKYPGRKATARQKAPDVIRLHEARWKNTDIARHLGISRNSVQRILVDYRVGRQPQDV
ncbi:recombinase family protein [Rhodovibrio salinarum]|uniref:Resolvase/invertase-type recombinase catalytic domain-containing protein n=1 Tax=Rhodovibrio salinarum TaxID=1087 RepID=A0A934QDY1_9PROT|nr:recombinase family protein [Rhodovibrio salinarum]MBK1695648.1 hypothetical protein [Rhodovibrio salinarum]